MVLLLVTASLNQLREIAGDDPHVGRLLTPRHYHSPTDGIPWACDNDAFHGFDAGRFCTMLGHVAGRQGCLFVAAPDVVADAKATHERFLRWAPVIRECGLPVAYVLQDGIQLAHLIETWPLWDAVFIGGTTEFKFSAIVRRIVRETTSEGKWAHMGRVNTTRRIEYAASIGCDSVDGSKWARWRKVHLLRGVQAMPHRQLALSEEKEGA